MHDVDATLFNSAGVAVYAVTRQSRGSFSAVASAPADAAGTGAFRLCFSNRLSSVSEKEVVFALHAGGESGAAPAGLRELAKREHVSLLDKEVRRAPAPALCGPAPLLLGHARAHPPSCHRRPQVSALVESVAAVEDEQRYVWARERAARDLNEATNTSVARWSFLELATMIAVGLAQAWAMKNYFETKVHLTAAPPRRALPRARAATAATPPPPSRALAAPAEPILTRQRRRRRQRAHARARACGLHRALA